MTLRQLDFRMYICHDGGVTAFEPFDDPVFSFACCSSQNDRHGRAMRNLKRSATRTNPARAKPLAELQDGRLYGYSKRFLTHRSA